MGNQRLAAGKAHFRMTSQGGVHFVPGTPAKYSDLFTFDDRGVVVLRPGVTVSTALATIQRSRPYKPPASNITNLFPDEVQGTFREGAVQQVTVNVYERDRRARLQCIQKYGSKCCICGLSFGEKYGDEFDGLIHVHHLRPLSKIGKEYVVDPIRDLRPVCPNCHMVVHRRDPAYGIEEVRSFLHLNGAAQ
jgi:predicted HNH restriction endonuclease